jgi:ACS family hexuronate transporter-like MFS transporter
MATGQAPIAASNYRWVILAASLLSCDMYYFALQSVPPLMTTMQSVFAVDAATAGLLMSVVVVPGFILAIPAGLLISKYGFRRLGFLTLISVTIGSLITASATTFSVALFGRFITGFGSCFLTIGTAAIIPQWFQKKELGTAMGIYSIGAQISAVAAFLIVPLLAQSWGWRSPFYFGAVAGVGFAVFFVVTIRDKHLQFEPNPTNYTGIRQSLKNREIWKIGLMWLFFSIASSGFVTWAPSLFTTFKGITPVYASIISSTYMASKIFFVPFYGWLSDRTGSRKPFVVAGLFATAASIFALSFLEGAGLVVGVLIVGASAGTVPALAFVLMAQAVSVRQAGLGFGMMSFWNRTATIIEAPLIGFFLQTSQSMGFTLMCLSSFALIGAVLVLSVNTN